MAATAVAQDVRLERVRNLWITGKAHREELGRLLYEEREERLSTGGAKVHVGFNSWLRDAGIPRASAYRRIAEYEISIGIRVEKEDTPDPVSVETPSTEVTKPAVYPVENYSDINPDTGRAYNAPPTHIEVVEGVGEVTVCDEAIGGNRGHGMALSRWRDAAEALGYKLGCRDDNFILTDNEGKEINLGMHEGGLRKFFEDKQPAAEEPSNYNVAGTRGYKDKPSLNIFLRRLMAIGAVGITSPFPSAADEALHECSSEDVPAVIHNINAAIKRLSEYRTQFEAKTTKTVKKTKAAKARK
jgi:hypothetical protein